MPYSSLRTFFFLLFIKTATACHGQTLEIAISCEAAARRLGQPLDGWKIVVIRSPQGDLNERCAREAVALPCAPLGTQVYHPETRVAECCPITGSIVWQDEEAKLGFCCASGHKWTGDISTGEGGCCPTGLVMVDGFCIPEVEREPVAGGGCGCSSKRNSTLSDSGTETDHLGAAESGPGETDPIDLAGVNVDLGIRYGHCYHLSVEDGRRVGSNRENAVYTPGGLFSNIPFRVCGSTDDCSVEQADMVSSQSRFFLQDQVGRHNDPNGTMGWVARSVRGTLNMMFTTDIKKAMSITGSRSKAWVEGTNCNLKLGRLPLELIFIETTCMVVDEPKLTYSSRRGSDEL